MRSSVSAGDEWPNGSSVFQTTLVVGPNSAGRRVLVVLTSLFLFAFLYLGLVAVLV